MESLIRESEGKETNIILPSYYLCCYYQNSIHRRCYECDILPRGEAFQLGFEENKFLR